MALQFMVASPQPRGQFMPVAGANPKTTAPRDGRLGQLRQQVYEQLRSAIEQGRLPAGTRPPPSREPAASPGVSRNTELWAAQRLQAEGLVAARSSRMGAPEVDSFPFALWGRLARRARPGQRSARAQYLDPAGDPELRQAVALWLWASRGIRCDAAQGGVCSGSQQGIDLIARLLLDVGDEVLVEDPGYPGIRASLLGHGVLARPVALDAQGLRIDEGAAQWPGARMAVVTPTHQFPTGVCMGLARRPAPGFCGGAARTGGGLCHGPGHHRPARAGRHPGGAGALHCRRPPAAPSAADARAVPGAPAGAG